MTVLHEILSGSLGLFMALVAVVGGVLAIIIGIRIAKLTDLSSAREAMWLRHVRGLGRGEEPHEHSPEVLQAAQRQWLQHLGTMSVGAGIGILIGLVVSVALAQVALRAPFSLPFGLSFLLFIPPLWGGLLVSTWSSILAARRQLALRTDDTGVVRPDISHTISDYRSPLLPLVGAFPAVVFTVLTLILAPHYQPFLSFEQRYDALISPPRWILAIYPCALWLNVLLVEGCVRARVRAPGAILSPDTVLARRVSMGLIGADLVSLYGALAYFPSTMFIGAASLFQPMSESIGIIPYGALTAVELGTVLVCSIGGLLIISSGRLGGRLTGWPWSNRVARDGGAAARGGGVV